MKIKEKYNIFRVGILLLCVFILYGCSPRNNLKTSAITEESRPTANETSAATEILPIPTTQQGAGSDEASAKRLPNYSFIVALDYNKYLLNVDETVQFWNYTARELAEVKMVVPSNQKAGVFQLQTISLPPNNALKEYFLEGVTLKLVLENPLPVNEMLTLNLRYQLELPLKAGVLGYTAKQTNLSDWYPFVAPYTTEQGWIIHQPSAVGEYLIYDRADFDLVLTVQGPEGLVVAASAQVVPDIGEYRIKALNARNITFSVSDDFVVLSKEFGNVTVQGFAFEENEASGWVAVENTGNALLLYSELFGVDYPHKTMTIVEADFPDGMEYDGLYFLSQGYFKTYEEPLKNYLTLLSVHETAHQWWYGIVGNDQALEPWLDESLATYSEYLYLEAYHPELVAWWWEYRVKAYDPGGNVGMTIYDQSDLRKYINAVYLRGALFLHETRLLLGDEIFFTNLRRYQNTYKFQNADRNNFFTIFEGESSDAFNLIIQKYFIN